jgi:hypothetical protein
MMQVHLRAIYLSVSVAIFWSLTRMSKFRRAVTSSGKVQTRTTGLPGSTLTSQEKHKKYQMLHSLEVMAIRNGAASVMAEK